MNQLKTIFQISSGLPLQSKPVGISIIRISGPLSLPTLHTLSSTPSFKPRTAKLVSLQDPARNGLRTDSQALATYFPAPHSFTGEDVVELHVHGNRVVVDNVFRSLRSLGLEHAEPGEFTRRAFHQGKLDLTQVEGLADLLNASTHLQTQLAMAQLDGHLGRLYEQWRGQLIQLLAQMEALIDFGETEMDVQDQELAMLADMDSGLRALREEMSAHLDDNRRGELIRDGVYVTLSGPANVGKSSLLNQLARRDVAIVTDVPGTTRDVVSCSVEIGGVPLHVSDTAGMRATSDVVELEGIRRTKRSIQSADVSIAVFQANELDLDGLEECEFEREPDIVLLNKIDLVQDSDVLVEQARAVLCKRFASVKVLGTSCMESNGIAPLVNALQRILSDEEVIPSAESVQRNHSLITRSRHRELVLESMHSLEQALSPSASQDLVLKCEETRQAAVSLGKITGKIDIEEILDSLFHDFCIGK